MSRPARRTSGQISTTSRSRRPAARRGGPDTTRSVAVPSAAAALDLALTAAAEAAAASPAPTESFAALGLPQRIVTVLQRRGVHAPFAIQARTLPDALAGRDVLGRAQTGSGKTLAFGLPMLARLTGERRLTGAPRGLVLVPTRELAEQVKEALAPLAHAVDLRVTAIYGGTSMKRQIDALRRGVDIVVACPGRLEDLISQGECSLRQVSITVLDEADHMADLGFLPAVTRLLEQTPAGGQRLLFSATLDRGVDRLVRTFLSDPALHAVTPAAAPVESMDHRAFTLRAEDKTTVTAEITGRHGRTLVFVRTKHGADRLAKHLRRAGIAAGAIHGNLNQNARQRALDSFSTGHAPVLVATDVAARGLHVDDIELVVHFDPPADHKDYLHRSGRTARAGADGIVLSLLLPEQGRPAARLFDLAGVRAGTSSVTPGDAAVRALADSGTPIVLLPTPVGTAPAAGGARSGGSRSGGQRTGGQRPARPRTQHAGGQGDAARRPDSARGPHPRSRRGTAGRTAR
jgi:superfamily II DNA/RNA helicase